MKNIIQQMYQTAAECIGQGSPANYIPALASADRSLLAVAVTDLSGRTESVGDSKVRFTLQSISKVILLAAALADAGFENVFRHVGMEPTGDPFDSIVRLETISSRPANPMINAGAIAMVSCIKGTNAEDIFHRLLVYARDLLGNQTLDYDRRVYLSEKDHSGRNKALAYMMESANVISGVVSEQLEVYFKICSLLVNCEEISYLGAVLANNGRSPRSGKQLILPQHVHIIRSLMITCGMYDYSGEFAVRVGIPAKSGVGGGIMGTVPNQMGIGTFCPSLDDKGNSICGLRAMEFLSKKLSLALF